MALRLPEDFAPFEALKRDQMTGLLSVTAHFTCCVCRRHIFDDAALAELGLDELDAMGLILSPRYHGVGPNAEPLLGPLCTHAGPCTVAFLERLRAVLG